MISNLRSAGCDRVAPGATAAPCYRLRPYVRACIDGAVIVFLDLRRDRYWSAPVETAPAIAGLNPSIAPGEKSAGRLVALDLIEPGETICTPTEARARAPERQLQAPDAAAPSFAEIASFWAACLSAARTLETRRLDRALQALSARKAQMTVGGASAERALAVFEALRPWYPRARVCLFDSLALMRFMLSRGVAPDLVLGVRTTPFAAHCWLELDGALVGDSSDHCASFVPIAWI